MNYVTTRDQEAFGSHYENTNLSDNPYFSGAYVANRSQTGKDIGQKAVPVNYLYSVLGEDILIYTLSNDTKAETEDTVVA